MAAAAITLLAVMTTGFLWAARRIKTARNPDSSVALNTKDLRNLGISLIGSNEPSFDSLMASVVPNEARENVEALRSVSVFLTNDTDHSVIAYSVKWEMVTGDGKLKTETREYLAPNALMGRSTVDLIGVIQPHSTRLVSLAPLVEAAKHPGVGGGAGPGTRGDSALQHYVDALRARNAQDSKITISLDSVLFDDGRFAGPDTRERFGKIQAIIQAKQDLLTEFEHTAESSKSLQIAFDNLTTVASGTKRELSSNATTEDYFGFYKQSTAREMLSLRSAFGEDEAAKRIHGVLHHEWPILRKAN
ncbi:MAG TPA: hypothetical protein VK557_10150 [Pyrinomonadaceae bacterium]|nr:hypothetical protein [Pyrinomonadaceae bacterium]